MASWWGRIANLVPDWWDILPGYLLLEDHLDSGFFVDCIMVCATSTSYACDIVVIVVLLPLFFYIHLLYSMPMLCLMIDPWSLLYLYAFAEAFVLPSQKTDNSCNLIHSTLYQKKKIIACVFYAFAGPRITVPRALRWGACGAVTVSSSTALLVRLFSPECEPQNIETYDKGK